MNSNNNQNLCCLKRNTEPQQTEGQQNILIEVTTLLVYSVLNQSQWVINIYILHIHIKYAFKTTVLFLAPQTFL